MINRRSAVFAGLALAALLAAGTAYLSLRPAPHMPTFEPPSKLKREEYASKSEAELLQLAEAGDWGALKAINPMISTEQSNAAGRLLRRYAAQGYDEARLRLGEIHLWNSVWYPDLFDNTDFRSEPIKSCRQVLENFQERREFKHDFASRKEGLTLLELAVQGGHPAAQIVLGKHFLKDEKDSPRNIPRALNLLDRTARAGETQAAAVLTRLYYQDTLVPRDDSKCLEYARLTKNPLIPAALLALNKRGDQSALSEALRAFTEAERKDPYSHYAPPIIRSRLEICLKPAEHSDEWASERLQDTILVSEYDQQCRSGGAAWFEEDPMRDWVIEAKTSPAGMGSNDNNAGACIADAQSGDKIAQYALGCSRLLLHGDKYQTWISRQGKVQVTPESTDEDKAEGVEWLRKSAGQGFHAAMGKLGECLLRGVGVKADKVEGAYWLARATTDIHTRYAKLRDEALAALTPEERSGILRRVDEARAKIIGNKSAESPNP